MTPDAAESLAHHAEGLRRLARRLVGDAGAADDVVQDACVAALQRGPAGGAPLGPWLVRVVRNLSARWRRGRAREDRRLRSLVVRAAAPPPEDALDRARLHRRLLRVLLTLDEPYRTTLLLRFFDDLPPRVIASRTGIPSSTVRTHVHRGLTQLRDRLERLDGEEGRRGTWAMALLPLADGPRRGLRASHLGGRLVASKAWIAATAGVALLLGAGGVWLLRAGNATAPASLSAAPPPLAGGPVALAAKPTDGKPAPAHATPAASPGDERSLRGVVTDEKGQPIVGASVATLLTSSILQYDADNRPIEVAGDSTRCFDDGTFELPLAAGAVVSLRATAAGFATSVLDEARAGQRVTIVLASGTSLTIRAVDEEGRGVPDARVRLFAPRDWQEPSPGVEAAGVTGADGRCVLEGLPMGSWSMVNVVHDSLGWTLFQRIDLPPAGPAEQIVVLRVGRKLVGRVTNLESGDPIAGARVGLGADLFHAVTTDAAGEFELSGSGVTGADFLQLCAAAPGFSNAMAVLSAETRYELRLAPGATIAGRVVTVAGSPIAGARLRVSGGDVQQRRYATSDDDGRFELDGARRGAVQTLVVAAAGFGRTHLDLGIPDTDRYDVKDVVLPAGRAIEGVVLGVDGRPVGEVTIHLLGTNRDRGRLLPRSAHSPDDPFRSRQTTRTDASGRFRFANLSPSAYDIEVSPRGRRGITRAIEVGEAEDVRGLELRLLGNRSLRVHVHDPEGRPLAGVQVTATCADPYAMNATTGAAGLTLFWDDAPFQGVEATPGAERWIPSEKRRLSPDETDVELVLRPAVLASGVVVGTDGRPVGQNLALAVTQGGVSLLQQSAFSKNQTFTSADGRFRVLVPVDSTVEVEAFASVLDDGTVIGGRLDGIRGGATGLELRLHPLAQDRTLRVVVLAPDGRPAPDVHVFVRVAARNVAGANQRTGADGHVAFSGLPESGAYLSATPLAESPGHDRWMPIAEPIRPHGEELTLRFREARVVHGVVRSADGSPAKDAMVTVLRNGERDAPVVADADGRFLLTLDLAEDPTIRVAAATSAAMSPWIDLPKDDAPLVITLSR